MAKLKSPFIAPWGKTPSDAIEDFNAAWQTTEGLGMQGRTGKPAGAYPAPPKIIMQSAEYKKGYIGTDKDTSSHFNQYNDVNPDALDSDPRLSSTMEVKRIEYVQKRVKGRFAKGKVRKVTTETVRLMWRCVVIEFEKGYEPSPKGRAGKRSKRGAEKQTRKAAKRKTRKPRK